VVPADVDSVYRRFFPLIRAKCRRMLADAEEAQDVAQETFARLCGAGLMGRDARQVIAWIYRTSTRLAVDLLRQREGRPAVDAGAVDGHRCDPGHEDALATRQLLGQYAKRLGAGDLELLIMQRLDGMSQPQIALVLGTSERTLRRRLWKLDQRLSRITTELHHGT
jgi:RNA polymerase sigma-70 factor (ECF subfamily)